MFISMLKEKLQNSDNPQVPAVVEQPQVTVPAPVLDQEALLEKLGELIDTKVSKLAVPTTTTKRTVTIEEQVITPISQQPDLVIEETGDEVIDNFLMDIMK